MRSRLLIPSMLFALLLAASPVAAITKGGSPDGGEHPMVGELFFYVPDAAPSAYPDPGSWYTCSGTLVSPTVVITAGHCTFAIGLAGASTTHGGIDTTAGAGGFGGTDVWIEFGEDDAAWADYPTTYLLDGTLRWATQAERYAGRVAWLGRGGSPWHRGTSYPHPLFDDNEFWLHDLGVVVLDAPVAMADYATIAPLDYLDAYAALRGETTLLEVVGYGLEKVTGKTDSGGDTRRKADVKLMSTKSSPPDTYIKLSNNAKTGGTCFGDSGGPTFASTDSLRLVAVTSFGVTPNCTGTGYAYRIDKGDDLDFLADHGITPAVEPEGAARPAEGVASSTTSPASAITRIGASVPSAVPAEAQPAQRGEGLRSLVPRDRSRGADDRALVALPR